MFFQYIQRKIPYISIQRYVCDRCHLPKLCLGNELIFRKEEIELKKIQPCQNCKFHKMKNKKEVCKAFFEMDVLTVRYFADLCAPCGRFFQKK